MFWHLIHQQCQSVEWCNRPKKDSQSRAKNETHQPVDGRSSPAGVISLPYSSADCRWWVWTTTGWVVQDGSQEIMITLLLLLWGCEGLQGGIGGRVFPPADEVPSGNWLEVFAKNSNSNPTRRRTHNRIVTCF